MLKVVSLVIIDGPTTRTNNANYWFRSKSNACVWIDVKMFPLFIKFIFLVVKNFTNKIRVTILKMPHV
jgi:hypothetical protein